MTSAGNVDGADPPGGRASNTPKHGGKHPRDRRVHHRKHHLDREVFDEREPGTGRAHLRTEKTVAARAVHRPNTGRAPSNIAAHAAAPTRHRPNTALASPMHVRQRVCTAEITDVHDVVRAAHRCVTSCAGDVAACSGRARSCSDVFRDDHRGRHGQTRSTKTYLVGEELCLCREKRTRRRPRQLLFRSTHGLSSRRIRPTCEARFFAKNLKKRPKGRRVVGVEHYVARALRRQTAPSGALPRASSTTLGGRCRKKARFRGVQRRHLRQVGGLRGWPGTSWTPKRASRAAAGAPRASARHPNGPLGGLQRCWGDS